MNLGSARCVHRGCSSEKGKIRPLTEKGSIDLLFSHWSFNSSKDVPFLFFNSCCPQQMGPGIDLGLSYSLLLLLSDI